MSNLSDFYPVRPQGTITTIDNSRLLSGFIRELFEAGRQKIILDFSGINEISGSFAGFLTELISDATAEGGNLLIANASPTEREILTATGFGGWLVTETIHFPVKESRILLVEDDEAVREMTREYLSDFGYEVTVAFDGFLGYSKWRMLRHHIQLVVSDIEMPRMDGLDLMTRILTEDPRVPFVMMTGYARSDKIRGIQTLRPGIKILSKPFISEQLEKAVLTEFQNIAR